MWIVYSTNRRDSSSHGDYIHRRMRGCIAANTRERGNVRTHARTRDALCTLFAIMRSLHRPGSRRSSNKESKDKQPYMDGWTNTLSHESHTAPAGPATCVLRAYVRGN